DEDDDHLAHMRSFEGVRAKPVLTECAVLYRTYASWHKCRAGRGDQRRGGVMAGTDPLASTLSALSRATKSTVEVVFGSAEVGVAEPVFAYRPRLRPAIRCWPTRSPGCRNGRPPAVWDGRRARLTCTSVLTPRPLVR